MAELIRAELLAEQSTASGLKQAVLRGRSHAHNRTTREEREQPSRSQELRQITSAIQTGCFSSRPKLASLAKRSAERASKPCRENHRWQPGKRRKAARRIANGWLRLALVPIPTMPMAARQKRRARRTSQTRPRR